MGLAKLRKKILLLENWRVQRLNGNIRKIGSDMSKIDKALGMGM